MTTVCPNCHTVIALGGEHDCADHLPPPGPEAVVVALNLLAGPTRRRLLQLDVEHLEIRLKQVGQCQHVGEARAWICKECADSFATMLKAVPDIVDQINLTRAGTQGIDYRTVGGGSGGSKTMPLPVAPAAYLARDEIRKVLLALVRACTDLRVQHSHHLVTIPHRGDIPAMATWLLWRVDGMALHPEFDGMPQALGRTIERALRVIDRPPTRQDLGACPTGCGGRFTAVQGHAIGECSRCQHREDAQPIRDGLLRVLDDRLCTASEIARLSTYLGLTADRKRVETVVRVWSHRGRIKSSTDPRDTAVPPRSLYRFGDVHPLLVAQYGTPGPERSGTGA